MRKFYLAILCCCCMHGFGQMSFKGSVMDTSEKKSIANAVVSLVTQKDSILIKFTRSKADGSFQLNNIHPGNYFILITYPGYADYSDTITNDPSKSRDLGSLPMIRRSQLLQEVIVSQKIAAIRMKGDTLAYRADSFATRQGATVEDLLKKLPGIQVDRSGKITAQGKQVNKVLVDGEEFFSDDPAVVTKGLPADAVKEVQVFDKKSDQAEFTGIDDGKGSRTINLTLKDDRKKGYFGKAQLAGGTRETFDNNLMLNAFRGKRKFSVFGIMSNTGKDGLDWSENDKFGGGNGVEFDEDQGGFTLKRESNEEFNEQYSDNEGLPSAWSAGAHFSNKWDKDEKNINADYKFLKRDLSVRGSTISQYILPDTQYFKNETNSANSNKFRHFLKGIYDVKLDSFTSMKVYVAGYHNDIRQSSDYSSTSLNENHGLVNSNARNLDSRTIKEGAKGSVLWRRKFRTKGRTLSVSIDEEVNNENLNGFLKSNTQYFGEAGMLSRSEVIDQRKSNADKSNELQTKIVYTEPLSKVSFLSFNYAYELSQSNSNKNTFNRDSAGFDYSAKDPLFSNDFRFRYATNIAGMDYKLNRKKMVFFVGSAISNSQYSQTDLVKDSSRKYSFVNFFPKAGLRITPNPQKQFSVDYSGRNRAPDLEQLQPVRVNTDPLNIQLGNPSLRQEFTHRLNANYYNFKVITETDFYTALNLDLAQNAISTSSNVDSNGKSTFQYINVKNNYSVNYFLQMGKKIPFLKMRLGIGPSFNYGQNRNKVNGYDNINTNSTYSLEVRGYKIKEEKYSFDFWSDFAYNYSKTSLRPDVTTKYFSNRTGVSGYVSLPWKTELRTDADLNFRQKTDVFDVNRNSVKIDVHYSKKFGKTNISELRLSCFDILDQNIGFRRSINTNFISQNSFQTLRRYFMISLISNFSKNPKK